MAESMSELIEEFRDNEKLHSNEGRRGVQNLCRIVHAMGYRDTTYFGQFHQSGSYGDLIEFLEDNSGCIEAILEWIIDNGDAGDWKENLESHLPEKEPDLD